MRTWIAIPLSLALLAVNATAQYSTAKRMARDAQGKINERHRSAEEGEPPPGLPPKPGAPAPATPPVPTPPPAVAPVKPSSQQLAASKLKADLAEAHTKGEASAELKKQFVADLAAAVQGRSRPSAAALAKFGEDLIASFAPKKVALNETDKLIKAIVVSLNSAGLSATRLQELNDEVQTLLTKAGVPAGDVSLAGQNLAAVVSEIQSNLSK